MKNIQLDSIISLKTDTILATSMDDEIVILDTINGKYFGLDGVGARVWEILQTAQSVDQVKKTLLDEYDVDEQECENDLIELLNGLCEAKLLVVS